MFYAQSDIVEEVKKFINKFNNNGIYTTGDVKAWLDDPKATIKDFAEKDIKVMTKGAAWMLIDADKNQGKWQFYVYLPDELAHCIYANDTLVDDFIAQLNNAGIVRNSKENGHSWNFQRFTYGRLGILTRLIEKDYLNYQKLLKNPVNVMKEDIARLNAEIEKLKMQLSMNTKQSASYDTVIKDGVAFVNFAKFAMVYRGLPTDCSFMAKQDCDDNTPAQLSKDMEVLAEQYCKFSELLNELKVKKVKFVIDSRYCTEEEFNYK